MIYRRFTDEQKAYLMEIIPKHSHKETIDLYNNKYPDQPINEYAVRNFSYKHRITTKNGGYFQKGQIPHNKGKKREEYLPPEVIEKIKVTQFKKGQKSINKKPVGTTRLTEDGYIEVKIADPNKWETLSRVVWREHFGEIPKGYIILHKNGISTDDRIENLVMLSRAEQVRLNQSGLYVRDGNDNSEINESAIQLAKLNSAIGKAKRRKKGKN